MAGSRRLPRLSRGQRTIRNFFIFFLALALWWALPRIPLWMVEREIRTVAEAQGVSEGNVRVLWAGSVPCESGDGGHLPFYPNGLPLVLAQGGGRLWMGYLTTYEGDTHLGGVRSCPEPEGPALIYLVEPRNGGLLPDDPLVGAWAAAVQLEHTAAAVRLALPQGSGYQISEEKKAGDAVILFPIPKQVLESGQGAALPYVLEQTDQEGTLLETVSGTLTAPWR
jgi:hypothetical protein